MSSSAEKYIPGLGTEFFIHPSHVSANGGAEKYIPGLGNQVHISANSINSKGGAEKYIPGLGKQFDINPAHILMDALAIELSQADPVETSVLVTAVVSGGVTEVTTKYLSGTHVVADFASAGTEFSGSFSVTSNGAYTAYAIDALGNETVSVITISSLV